MRNLKKILALVLALMMTLSLMVTASAAYTDGDSISGTYAEAAQVLTDLGIYQGNEKGEFAPKATITRAEVAAILYRAVTGDVNDLQVGIYADYNQFDDVASTAWYAGYVNFCANAGLILGDGQGHFYPMAKVTGYELLAMLQRAIGYGREGEFQGTGWQLRTASQAKKLGITANINTGTLGAAATREAVAEMVFRGIMVPTVDYTLLLGYEKDFIGYEDNNNTKPAVYNTLGYEQFGLIGKVAGQTDEYGRPCAVWVADVNDDNKASDADITATGILSVIADKPVATYYTKVTECDLAQAVNGGKTMTNVTTYTNGVAETSTNVTLDALHTTTDSVGAQGRTTEVYKTGTNSWTIVYVDTLMGVVTGVTPVTYDTAGHIYNPASLSIKVNDNVTVVSYAAKNFSYKLGDMVLLTTYGMNNGSTLPTAAGDFTVAGAWAVDVVGAPTLVDVTVKGTVGPAATKVGIVGTNGTTYLASNVYTATTVVNGTPDWYNELANAMINRTYKLALDAKGNIVGMVPIAGTTVDVGVVIATETKSSGLTGKHVIQTDLMLGDGSVKTLDFVQNATTYYLPGIPDPNLVAGAFVKFTSTVLDGKTYYYTTDANSILPGEYTNDNDTTVATGVANTLNGIIINDATKFLVAQYAYDYSTSSYVIKGYQPYTGFKTLPTLGTQKAAFAVHTSNGVTYVVIAAKDATNPYTTLAQARIVPDDSYLVLSKAVTYQYYSVYNVVKNGVKSTINVSNAINATVDGFIADHQLATFGGLTADGYYTAVTASTQDVNGTSTCIGGIYPFVYSNGVITINSTFYLTVADNCQVQIVNLVNNELYTGTLDSIAQYDVDNDHEFTFELDANGYVCNIYIID